MLNIIDYLIDNDYECETYYDNDGIKFIGWCLNK